MTRGRTRPAADAPPAKVRRPAPTSLAGVVALALAVSACSIGSEAGDIEAAPTFVRANGSSLAVEEPVASVSDLIGPAAEGEPWTIVGSVFDPDLRAFVATVWSSDDGESWDPATVEPARRGVAETMAAAVPGPDGLVAVGQVDSGAEADAVIWHHADGEWLQSRPDAMAGDHEQWASDVAVGESGVVVAGGENAWGEARPRMWFSADGEAWASVDGGPGGPFDGPGEESVRGVTAVGGGFVAVGSRTVDNDMDAAVWFSPDGESWAAVDDPDLGGEGRQGLLSAAVVDGVVVAAGFANDLAGQGQPVVWRSADGTKWNPHRGGLPMDNRRAGARDLSVRSLSVSGTTLLASGGNDWRPHIWRSTDAGVNWKELANPVHGDLFQDGVSLRNAVESQGVTVALGANPAVLVLSGPRWEDATGDTFPTGGAQPFATSVAANADVEIAAGGRRTAPSGETREDYAGQIWREDGGGWEPVASENLAAGQVRDLTEFAGGFVAVGFENFGLANQREVVADKDPDGLVWVSPDGTTWGRIGHKNAEITADTLEYLENPRPELAPAIAALERGAPPESAAPAGGEGTRSLSGVAPLGDGFIAVGAVYDENDGDPIVIVSPDGRAFVGEEPLHRGPGIQEYTDVCASPEGTAVAVGQSGLRGGYDITVAFRDAEGKWTAGENRSFGGSGSQQAYACAADENGFVVVGSDGRSGSVDARIWVSEDGLAWEEITSGLLGGSGDQWASAAAAVPDGEGWLVAGSDTMSGNADVALWRITADGDVSRRDHDEPALGGPGEQSVSDITIEDDGRVTLAGNDYGRIGLWESDVLDR
jgi:hypothetical protein